MPTYIDNKRDFDADTSRDAATEYDGATEFEGTDPAYELVNFLFGIEAQDTLLVRAPLYAFRSVRRTT